MYLPSGVLITTHADAYNHISLCESCLANEQCSKAISFFNADIDACWQLIEELDFEYEQLLYLHSQEKFQVLDYDGYPI